MFRGDTLQFVVQVQQVLATAPVGMPPTPANITGWSFWCTGKYAILDPDNLGAFQLSSSTSGVSIVNPTIGQVEFTVPSSSTAFFPDRRIPLFYDVHGTDTTGGQWTVELGRIDVFPQASRVPTIGGQGASPSPPPTPSAPNRMFASGTLALLPSANLVYNQTGGSFTGILPTFGVFDGAEVEIDDVEGAWGAHPFTLQAGVGFKVANPANPQQVSALGGSWLLTSPGASVTLRLSLRDSTWLIV